MKLTYLSLFIAVGVYTFSTPSVYSDVYDAPNMATSSTMVWKLPHRLYHNSRQHTYDFARNLWDMQYFDNAIFISHGNRQDNLGPVYIYALTVDGNGTPTFTLDETLGAEAVVIMRVLNNELIASNDDPGGGGGTLSGSLYSRDTQGNWTAHWVSHDSHFYDVAYWNGEWYFSGYKSADRVSWSNMNLPQSGATLNLVGTSSWLWVSQHFSGPVYVTTDGTNYIEGVSDASPDIFSSLTLRGYGPVYKTHRSVTWKNSVLYTVESSTAPLYHFHETTSGFELDSIEPFGAHGVGAPGDYMVADIVVQNDLVYVLANKNDNGNRTAEIFMSHDLKDWQRLAVVPVPSYPRSFEILNGHIFIGLSTHFFGDINSPDNTHSGEVYQVDATIPAILGNTDYVKFKSDTSAIDEADTTATITLERIHGTTGAASVTVSTTTAGTADASEFTANSQVVHWADGDDADKTIDIAIAAADTVDEADKTIQLVLSSPSGTALYHWTTAHILIEDDDGPPPVVDAGPEQRVGWASTLAQATLDGTVTDDGTFTVTWTATGPEPVHFTDRHAVDTTAIFPAKGEYTLILTADDGINFPSSDRVEITVSEIGPVEKITYAGAGSFDQFGLGLSIDGDRAIISSRRTNGASSGGAVYFYRKVNHVWTFEAEVYPENDSTISSYMSNLHIKGDLATAVDENNACVYVFRRTNSTWSYDATLNADSGDSVYSAAPVSGDTIAFGGAINRSAYVYTQDPQGIWTRQEKIQPTDGVNQDWYGSSIALDGDTLAVGAFGQGTGAVYIYTRNNAAWTLQQKLTATQLSRFGLSLDLTGNRLVVCTPGDNQTEQGFAEVFERINNTWNKVSTLQPADGDVFNYFGQKVVMHQDLLIVQAIPFNTEVEGYNINPQGLTHYLYRETTANTWEVVEPFFPEIASSSISMHLNSNLLMIGNRADDMVDEYSGAAYLYDIRNISVAPVLAASADAEAYQLVTNQQNAFSGIAAESPTGAPLTYAWDFDNDGNTDSTEQHPSHAYTTAGTYTATLTVSDGIETATDTVTLTVNSPYSIGYTNWISAFNWGGETATAPEDNPDGDDLNNFLEYALGSNPIDGTSSHLPTFLRNGNAFDVTFRRERASATYTLQSSTDLVIWTDESINPGTIGADVTESIPMGSEELLFIRLKVEE